MTGFEFDHVAPLKSLAIGLNPKFSMATTFFPMFQGNVFTSVFLFSLISAVGYLVYRETKRIDNL